MAASSSSSQPPLLNPVSSPTKPSPCTSNLPPPLYPPALHPKVRSNRRFILAINWLSAFMLGHLTLTQLSTFVNTQLKRKTFNEIIHGLWIEDLEGQHLRVPNITWKSHVAVERALYDILKDDKDMAEFLHTYWSTLTNWTPIQWDQITVNSATWPVIKDQFYIVICQFLKHGQPNDITLSEYVYTVKKLFKQVNMTQYFRESETLKFVGNEDLYSYISNKHTREVMSTNLSNAFRDFSTTHKTPNFTFRVYKSKKAINKRGAICVFYEARVTFDLDCKMLDHPKLFVCDHGSHNPALPGLHRCVLLNHIDRENLKEDTV